MLPDPPRVILKILRVRETHGFRSAKIWALGSTTSQSTSVPSVTASATTPDGSGRRMPTFQAKIPPRYLGPTRVFNVDPYNYP